MENPVPDQTVTYQTPPVQEKSHTPYFLYVLILLLLILLPAVGGLAYYLGTESASTDTQSTQTESTNTDTSAVPSPFVTTLLSNYLKRQFSVNENFFLDKQYPEEVKVSDSSLIGMNCSERINCESPYTNCTYYPKNANTSEPPTKVTDQRILEIIKQSNLAKDELNPSGDAVRTVIEATICETEDNRTIVEYKTGGGGGGAGSMDFVGTVNPDGTVKKVGSMSENTAYFGCYKPLQLTTDNILYYQCGGGDGPSGSSTLYKIDLNANTTEALLSCFSTVEEVNGVFGEPVTTCK